MFSGIVEEVGHIHTIQASNDFWTITISATKVLNDCQIGDSIAVNGTCLTVIHFDQNTFTVNVVPETLSRTNLGSLKVKSLVNLERAIQPMTRIGGHLIQGHVDTQCQFMGFEQINNGTYGKFSLPQDYAQYFIDKGYVALDGMSLTIAHLADNYFLIAFIPHTIAMTNLQGYQPNQAVNIEVDMVGKYLQRFIEVKEKNNA